MRGQQFADFLNRFDQRVAEFLILKMRPHSFDNTLPKLVAAFLVDGLVPHHSKLVCTWGHENQHRVSLTRFVHTKLM